MTATDVDRFLDEMGHGRRADIDRLRAILREADATLVETVKWNAPSYAIGGRDRITFRLRPGDRVELIFHLGAKKGAVAPTIEDPAGLLRRLAPDRAITAFADAADIEAKSAALITVVRQWLRIPAA